MSDVDKFDLYASLRFATEAGAKQCPMCSSDGWVVESSSSIDFASVVPQSAPTSIMKDADTFWDGPVVIPTIALTCQNCGFIRQHNLKWIKQAMRPKAE